VFTDELSERNTKIILCNTFFLRHFLAEPFPPGSDLVVQLEALDATTIIIPAFEIVPPPSAPHTLDALRIGTHE
jgi:hypothetical protein